MTISNVTESKTCAVLFEYNPIGETLYAVLTDEVYYNNVKIRSSYRSVLGTSTATTKTIYKTTNTSETETGTTTPTYYFAGNVADNWVKFANAYWRIIRTNEDGSVRLLYAGTSPDTTSGYLTNMAYSNGSSSATDVNWSSSNLNNASKANSVAYWYSNLDSKYKDLISTSAIYCNDMSSTGSSTIHYGAYTRLNTNKTPTFKCSSTSYEFKQGYGLMTADEVAFAGGVYATNSPYAYYYLNSAGESVIGTNYFWTMSPWDFDGSNARVSVGYGAQLPGYLYHTGVSRAYAVRPVVSLKNCVTISAGNGTSSNPYTVELPNTCATVEN